MIHNPLTYEKKYDPDQPRDEAGRFSEGAGFNPIKKASDVKSGSTLKTQRMPLNLGTGTGPKVSHEIEVTGVEQTRMGKVILGRVTKINEMDPISFLNKDPVYSKATAEQRHRLLNSVRIHESHLEPYGIMARNL